MVHNPVIQKKTITKEERMNSSWKMEHISSDLFKNKLSAFSRRQYQNPKWQLLLNELMNDANFKMCKVGIEIFDSFISGTLKMATKIKFMFVSCSVVRLSLCKPAYNCSVLNY
jgi:hypothetical protein